MMAFVAQRGFLELIILQENLAAGRQIDGIIVRILQIDNAPRVRNRCACATTTEFRAVPQHIVDVAVIYVGGADVIDVDIVLQPVKLDAIECELRAFDDGSAIRVIIRKNAFLVVMEVDVIER